MAPDPGSDPGVEVDKREGRGGKGRGGEGIEGLYTQIFF